MVSIPESRYAAGAPGLRGRRALITGSTGGIGLAVATRLAASGCDIVLHGLEPPQQAIPALAAVERLGVAARYAMVDIATSPPIEALVAEFGPFDILVNNATTRHFGAVEATAPADWDMDLAVNLSAAFHLIRLVLPGVRQRGWGRIVNISSIYGLIGAANRVGYVTTKTALIGLTRAVALETARSGITCNALCPGSTMTPNIDARIRAAMAASGFTRAEAEARFLDGKQPSGRFIEADAVGAMAAFLCSPEGRDITGAALPIDGAWSAA